MLDNHFIENAINQCVEEIVRWFICDSVELLDYVLDDDPCNPQYSANTVYCRLKTYLLFRQLYYNDTIITIDELLLNSGYTESDIEIFYKMRRKEAPLYYRDRNSKSDFNLLSIGQQLADVKMLDPKGDYIFLYTGRADIPRVSTHYTSDGYLITITYDDNNIISKIDFELI